MPGVCTKCGVLVEKGAEQSRMCAEPGIFWRFRPMKCCECALSNGCVSNEFFDKWACIHCKRRAVDRERSLQKIQKKEIESRELLEKLTNAASNAAEWERDLRTQAEERERSAIANAAQERERREQAV
jgi:hypothetical protein